MATDLFPGFTSKHVDAAPEGPSIFVRSKLDANKPPLLLIHGYPQTHVEFHKIAPLLTPHFSVVLVDLRGYGASSTVPSTNGSGYSKRLMADDCVSVMKQLGYAKYLVLGHDRGARVAYRMAFDHPEVVDKVVIVDVIPTATMFSRFRNVDAALNAYHWLFLAQPQPFPETMIRAAGGGKTYLDHTLASWTAHKTLDAFDPAALEAYTEAFCNEERIHSTCEDYRAGAFLDKVYDEEELQAGNHIQAPLLAVWGQAGLVAGAKADQPAEPAPGPVQIWQRYATSASGLGLNCGHFVPEEDPQGLVKAALAFLCL